MADYIQNPQRPNINPTPLPPPNPPKDMPPRDGLGMVPILGAVAVVGIVALVAWGMLDTRSDPENGAAAPAATQIAPVPDAVIPEVPAPAEPMLQPDVTPQEVPVPAPEVTPTPVPAPAPAPTN